jgi:hypothetical protein
MFMTLCFCAPRSVHFHAKLDTQKPAGGVNAPALNQALM